MTASQNEPRAMRSISPLMRSPCTTIAFSVSAEFDTSPDRREASSDSALIERLALSISSLMLPTSWLISWVA